ncbi:A24 family peptidase C-terminal domain-containing protein [Methanocaldococcus fervens]|uniref:Peptidase A24A domain protein n=1 Tax=Methanocaldococcus fervens (strain DSM 4213 / JCM 15782 / AG86) TaxID=573064 RepID=C7P863_METFA|nr:A24 family peptidase C-terminal domain-containing protein [Methanocaldococcus fervens]ACV24745.1 Peptidase A24A domain protein [Methanocaldococcus fervens AG86]
MDLLGIVYIVNFILLILASITDIGERIIPHKYTIAMIIMNLAVGYYYFGFDAIVAFFSTFILCLILSIGMGGGDVKLFTALAPIFAYPNSFVFYIPKYILYLIAISMFIAAIFPMFKILIRYWRDILPSACYLTMIIGILYYFINIYKIPYASIVVWTYIIISIFISRKFPKYKDYTKKLGYLFPVYLIFLYIFDTSYFINYNILVTSIIYLCEIILISVVIYALTGVETSDKKSVEELEEGDILRDVIIIGKDNNVEVKNLNIMKRIKFLLEHEIKKDEKEIILTDGEGLSKEDIEKIKRLHREGKIPDSLNVIKTYPFVPFVVVGYLITLMLISFSII